MKIIDCHLHLFDLNKGQYHWLKADNPPYWQDKHIINRSFEETDLTVAGAELAGFVHIEAGFDNQQPWREIEWLENTVNTPFKSVACCNLLLSETEFKQQIDALLQYQTVVGVRHIFDDDAAFILSQPQVLNNLAYVAKQQLIFELQLSLYDNKGITLLCQVLANLPSLKISLNHGGFPDFTNNLTLDIWQTNLNKLSLHKSLLVKVSGWEMTDRSYSIENINDILQRLLTTVSEDNIAFASNFPLCLFSTSYQDYWRNINSLYIERLNKLLYSNAARWYGFE